VTVAVDGLAVQNVPATVWVASGGDSTRTVIEQGGPAASFDFEGLMRGTK
jgi:hypothetical protein